MFNNPRSVDRAMNPPGSVRSPYGIREPSFKPPMIANRPNWLQTLIHKRDFRFPNQALARMRALLPRREATTMPRLATDYDTKLFAAQFGGQGSQAPLPMVRPSTDLDFPWPVGTVTGPPRSPTGRDYASRPPQAERPVYAPRTQPYSAVLSAHDHRRRNHPYDNFMPGLNNGPAPWRVPTIRKSGLQLMSGPHQHATQQQYGGVTSVAGASGSIAIAPPAWSNLTRGPRAASGILGRVQGPGRSRVPATFVPREVR